MSMSRAQATKASARKRKASQILSDEELQALKETKAERRQGGKGDGEADLLAKVAEMPEPDRKVAERLHAIVKANAPQLSPKTWYGMPAYADKDGKVVCFFTAASKFKSRYATFGFNDAAKLDDGSMWPTSFALTSLGDAEEKRIAALVRQAVG
jgi:uncharacterized protein YdhG (YjbR/CyaY superfamily)